MRLIQDAWTPLHARTHTGSVQRKCNDDDDDDDDDYDVDDGHSRSFKTSLKFKKKFKNSKRGVVVMYNNVDCISVTYEDYRLAIEKLQSEKRLRISTNKYFQKPQSLTYILPLTVWIVWVYLLSIFCGRLWKMHLFCNTVRSGRSRSSKVDDFGGALKMEDRNMPDQLLEWKMQDQIITRSRTCTTTRNC